MKRLLTEAGLGDKEEQEAPRGQQATPVAEGMGMGQCDRSWNQAGGEVSEGRTCCERNSTKPGEKEGKKCLCLSFLFHHTCQGLLLLECPQKPESRGPGGCSPQDQPCWAQSRAERVESKYGKNNSSQLKDLLQIFFYMDGNIFSIFKTCTSKWPTCGT